jgi:biotin synthase
MTKAEIIKWLQAPDPTELFCEADKVRKQFCGDGVYLRGIIEFSNYCKRNCCYCGLRKDNSKITRYRLAKNEIVAAAKYADSLGYGTVVLQSGEDVGYSIFDLCAVITAVKRETKCVVTMAAGELERDDYMAMKAAGADRYLLKIETSDRELFKRLKPDSSFDQRLQCLHWLKELGYEVGSGVMVGLPGQSLEVLADDILLFKELGLDMIGIGPFIPHPNTPLGVGTRFIASVLDVTLRMVALTRLITRNTNIPATTAVGTIDKEGRQKALQCGANIMMPNATPAQYRKYYEIYPDKICIDEKPADCQSCISAMLTSIGRYVATGPGTSLKNK